MSELFTDWIERRDLLDIATVREFSKHNPWRWLAAVAGEWLIIGVTIGTLAAVHQNSRVDYGSMAAAMVGISLPNFVLGPLLVLIFSLTLYWFPPARWDGVPSRSMVLPVLTLSAIYMAYIARLTRAGMLEVLRSDYIRTARAKGLDERHGVGEAPGTTLMLAAESVRP